MPSPAVDDLHAWLGLLGAKGIGRRTAALLLGHFGGPCEVMAAGPVAWSQVVDPSRCRALSEAMQMAQDPLRRCLSWLNSDPRHHIVTLACPDYPQALLHSPDPPLMLYAAGSLTAWQAPLVAMVGSRQATPLGLATARRLGAAISAAGVGVVSGMALGIDAAAHEGALSGGGPTIGVLGCGIDLVYPRRHHGLADQMIGSGLLVSEYSLGAPAIRDHFPQRNRIIAGLSVATVVVESTIRSGSLITARLAAEAGREVLAVPGSITNPQSAGCHALIQQGAGLLQDEHDIWESAPWAFGAQMQASGRGPRARPQTARRSGTRTGTDFVGEPNSSPTRRPCDRPPRQVTLPHLDVPEQGVDVRDPTTELTAQLRSAAPTAWLHRLLQGGPAGLDDLILASGKSLEDLQGALLQGELEGLLGRLPGGRYQWLGLST